MHYGGARGTSYNLFHTFIMVGLVAGGCIIEFNLSAISEFRFKKEICN